MCGRYTVLTEEDIIEIRSIFAEISKKFGTANAVASREVFPTNLAPVLTDTRGAGAEPFGLDVTAMRWGFPKWQGSGVIINARAETAQDKTMFRRALAERRVVVPSTGYYEWAHVGRKATDKYHITHAETPMLYMAGIAQTFRDAEGQPFDAYAILTTAPSASVAELHDRQPVILAPDELSLWCGNDFFVPEVLTRPAPELVLRLAA